MDIRNLVHFKEGLFNGEKQHNEESNLVQTLSSRLKENFEHLTDLTKDSIHSITDFTKGSVNNFLKSIHEIEADFRKTILPHNPTLDNGYLEENY